MRHSLGLGLLLIVTLNTAAFANSFNATEICSLIANGTKINDPRACNQWIECVNLTPISHTCGDLYYDRSTGECVTKTNITCISSNPCAILSANSTGFVPDPISCNSYYYCSSTGTASKGTCPTNYQYQSSTNKCVSTGNCTLSMDPNSYCNIVPDGVFIAIPDECQDYQLCWQSNLINQTCPSTFYFEAFDGVCKDDISICHYANITTNGTTTKIAASSCQQNGQFISDNTTCNGYYYCSANNNNGTYNLLHGNCTEGYFFDPSNNGECVPRENIVCDFDRCSGFGFNKIQLSNLSDDGCKGFAICQDGQEIAKAQCPTNNYFNEVTQRCTTQVVSYEACNSTIMST